MALLIFFVSLIEMLSGSIKFRITTTTRNGISKRAEIDIVVSISDGMLYCGCTATQQKVLSARFYAA
jgi:hypothetical protein